VGSWFIAIAFYSYSPTAPIRFLGLPISIALGVICLLLTPIHGMLGRMELIRGKSFWESDMGLTVVGFFSAFAAPIFAAIFLLLFAPS
jgi:hypothetical protein